MLGKRSKNTSASHQSSSQPTAVVSPERPVLNISSADKGSDQKNDQAIQQRVETAMTVVHPLILEAINVSEASQMAPEELARHIRPLISQLLNEKRLQLNAKEQAYLENRIVDDMIGLGPLEQLLKDETISDILVNGHQAIYIERFGKLSKTKIRFRDNEHIMNILLRIVSMLGRRVDETTPYVDARLQDGSRVNAIIPPLALDGPCISIRKFQKQTMTFEQMIQAETLSKAMQTMLSIAAKIRLNIIILGGTGSGKTTLLNALSHEIPASERIITIEDSAELQLQQPHVVRLETRPPNVEGIGAVTERHLVRNALRMRPDRIILGEIRGEEAFDMLQAMNTGHDGSMCTIHASSPQEVPARLTNMVMMSGYDFPASAILSQIAASINLLVQTERMRDGKRRVTNISEIISTDGQTIAMQSLFNYVIHTATPEEDLQGEFIYSGAKPNFIQIAAHYGIADKLIQALS